MDKISGVLAISTNIEIYKFTIFLRSNVILFYLYWEEALLNEKKTSSRVITFYWYFIHFSLFSIISRRRYSQYFIAIDIFHTGLCWCIKMWLWWNTVWSEKSISTVYTGDSRRNLTKYRTTAGTFTGKSFRYLYVLSIWSEVLGMTIEHLSNNKGQ